MDAGRGSSQGMRTCKASPFYEADGITIYHGDIRDLWPIEADVIVTDPPYGQNYRSRSGEKVAGDRDTEIRDWLLEQWVDGPALVFGTWKAGRPKARALLIWDKGDNPGAGDCSLPWGASHEEIYLRGAGWQKVGSRLGSVVRFQKPAGGQRPDHPTPKPVALMRHLLERCPSGLVLDPFMGSGSTLLAARQLGKQARRSTAISQFPNATQEEGPCCCAPRNPVRTPTAPTPNLAPTTSASHGRGSRAAVTGCDRAVESSGLTER